MSDWPRRRREYDTPYDAHDYSEHCGCEDCEREALQRSAAADFEAHLRMDEREGAEW